MPNLHLDDSIFDHPKVVGLSTDAKLVHLVALSWCAQGRTEGRIDKTQLPAIVARAHTRLIPRARTLADTLTKAGLWHRVPDGYRIHDFTDYNVSRSSKDARRAADAERKRRARQTRNGHVEETAGDPLEDVETDVYGRPLPANVRGRPRGQPADVRADMSANVRADVLRTPLVTEGDRDDLAPKKNRRARGQDQGQEQGQDRETRGITSLPSPPREGPDLDIRGIGRFPGDPEGTP